MKSYKNSWYLLIPLIPWYQTSFQNLSLNFYKNLDTSVAKVPHFWGSRSCLFLLSKLRQSFLPRSFFCSEERRFFSRSFSRSFPVPFSVPFLDHFWNLRFFHDCVSQKVNYIGRFQLMKHLSWNNNYYTVRYEWLWLVFELLVKLSANSYAKGTEMERSRSFLHSSDFRGIRSCLAP